MRIRHLVGWAAVFFLLPLPIRAADDEAIQRAIDRGVNHLKNIQDKTTGTWPYPENPIGASALAGVTLLECGASPVDPDMQRAADALRQASLRLTDTYTLALGVLFFDRFGDPDDVPLIESLAVRLLAGQNSSGGWSYECSSISTDEVRRLSAVIRNRNHASSSTTPPPRGRRMVSREIQKQLKQINPVRPGPSDNSNTKFATLALWVARRHGMPVEKSLSMVETRFRRSQNPDGGWGYLPGVHDRRGLGESLASMTCAGLLGLAIGHGAKEAVLRADDRLPESRGAARRPIRDPTQDPAVQAGLSLLGKVIAADARGPVRLSNFKEGDEYYFLWALERVAVAYGLPTIGGRDWYNWGADHLLARQSAAGAWEGKYPEGGVDTCFALLFLKRANLAKDLTVSLRGKVDEGPMLEGKGKNGDDKATQSPPAAEKPQPQPPISSAGKKDDPVPMPEKPASATEGDLEAETSQLVKRLIAADGKQEKIVEEYRDKRGVAYTQALAAAVPRLPESVKSKARDALAERFTRMTTATLRARLKDDDAEIRRACALACAMKEDKEHIPDLIPLLQDPDSGVARAAHVALKNLSGKDFGPNAQATSTEKAEAVSKWLAWWKQR
jgi:hypothetical protein